MQKEVKGKLMGVCSCGFMRTSGISISGVDNNEEREKSCGSGVIDDSKGKCEGYFRVCDKCGFDKCEMFQITSNESEITIFKCLKCGHSVRQAQGSSKA